MPSWSTVRTSSLTAISTRCVLHACSRDAPTDPQLPQVFRLAPLLYLEMLLELPPASYLILLLVRKMLSLTEPIVSESLPGLCSMHWPLFLMHPNSTPLVSPHSSLTDRARSTRLFDRHMDEFTFMNTKRSRALIDEA